MSTLVFDLLFALGASWAVFIALFWHLRTRLEEANGFIRFATQEPGHKPPDYHVSINDWGPDFQDSEVGRWRWVVWRGEKGEGAPVNLGNDFSGPQAWASVWSAIIQNWDQESFTPTAMIEWKKVTQHAHDKADERSS